MPFESYVLLVALAAILYSFIARVIQTKLINKKEMEAVQSESKRLNEEYKQASKTSDKARMDRIMNEQMELLPRMNKVMMGQFKPMIVILIIFFAFNWAITAYDPSKGDDFSIIANASNSACGANAGEGAYTACFTLNGTDYGKWVVSARALNGGSDIGENSTFFLYNLQNSTDTFLLAPKGEPVAISTDRQVYYPGDKVVVTVMPPERAKEVVVTIDSGTSFYVDLPFAIPILNVQRLHEPYWWFIFITLIAGLLISVALGQLQKRGVNII